MIVAGGKLNVVEARCLHDTVVKVSTRTSVLMTLGLTAVLVGCGRLGFENSDQREPDGGAGTPDGTPDAVTAVCGKSGTAPDPLTISGTVFRYTDFDGNRTTVGDATIRASINGVDETTISDIEGLYSMQVATNGFSSMAQLEISQTGSFLTRQFTDLPLDADVLAPEALVWQFGDAPLWSGGSMGSVYSAGPATLDATRGTLNVAVRDCDNAVVEGVIVSIEPAPELLKYQATNGSLDAPSSQGPMGVALGLNAVPGPTTITGTLAGRTVIPQTIYVEAGEVVTMITLRVVD